MAIAFDAVSNLNGAPSSSLSWSHTCTGADRILIVGIAQRNGRSVTAITYNGVAMTLIGTSGDTFTTISMYYLLAPATGANTISITFSSSDSDNNGMAVSYTGVHQTTPLGTFVSASNPGSGSTTPSVTASSASGELVVDTVSVQSSATQSITVGSGQTQRNNVIGGATSSEVVGGMSEEAGAASVVMSWTAASSARWNIGAVPLKPSVAASAKLVACVDDDGE